LDDISPELLLDCCSLVKANSIAGCKMNSVYVVYTRWKNLKKTNSMVDGAVGYHRPENVRRMSIGKNNPVVNALNKTKVVEDNPDLWKLQQDRERERIAEKKEVRKEQVAEQAIKEKQRKASVRRMKVKEDQQTQDILDQIERTKLENLNISDDDEESFGSEGEDSLGF